MPGKFSVHVDPDELDAQVVAAAFQHGDGNEARKGGRSGKPEATAPRGKAGRSGQSAAQPKRYAFRRS